MLTGLLEPTKGEAKIGDVDLFKQTALARKLMGVCPQHDVLFDLLTPTEHLRLYYEIKGATSGEEELLQLLKDVGLWEKRDALA